MIWQYNLNENYAQLGPNEVSLQGKPYPQIIDTMLSDNLFFNNPCKHTEF